MKSIVVTGATSGIGQATALDLASHGYRVIATARTAEKAEKLRACAAEHGCILDTVLLDVANHDSCQDAFAEIQDLTDGSGPWALVNNAGVVHLGAFEDIAEEQARAILEVNLLGAARLTRLVLPGMRRQGDGRIINMSSVGGLVSAPFNGWYGASKFALEALTDALRAETTGSGIRFVLIEPGLIDTPMVSKALEGLPRQSRYDASYALVRRLGPFVPTPSPGRVAHTVRRALNARLPRLRYGVGLETPVVRVAHHMPRLTDRILRAVVRLGQS